MEQRLHRRTARLPASHLASRVTLGQGLRIATRDLPPVDHVVESADVFRAAVLVLQVIGVLPYVQAEDRRIAVHQRAVLVAAALHQQAALGSHAEPGPAAAEAGQRSLGERILERLEAPELLIDGPPQVAIGTATALGRHHGPEQRVVGMPTAIVDNRGAQLLRQTSQLPQQTFHRLLGIGRAFQRGVQVVHIGLVVLAVVDLHGQRIDVRFQGIVGVRQGRQGVGHGNSPSVIAK
ncbi:phosphomannomutase [Pseudomonas aeruginosa VRFPA02]|nr:phosphomannomutase [Pseudomonas aeruginosa PA45]EOQ81422.1 phosphomannomutase [Pseudomonas aeruginosa VRFPA02]